MKLSDAEDAKFKRIITDKHAEKQIGKPWSSIYKVKGSYDRGCISNKTILKWIGYYDKNQARIKAEAKEAALETK